MVLFFNAPWINLPTESQTYLGETNDAEVSMLLPWHQDYPYNQGSKRSLTIYVPLQDGDKTMEAP